MWRGHKRDRGPGAFSAALPADPSSVAKARHAVARFGERNGASPAKIAVAVSEAVANAITHGSSREPDEPVYIEASVDGPAVVVRVHDQGAGMRPKPSSPGLGFGIPILGHLADQVAIDSSDSGVSVELRFRRQARDSSVLDTAGRRGGHARHAAGGIAAQM